MESVSTISLDEEIRLPGTLVAAMREFPAVYRMLTVWRHYPDVTMDEDTATDRWAAKQASAAFVEFLGTYNIGARMVIGIDSREPLHDYHWWVRIDCPLATVNVDWTARQFHNLHHPPDPGLADLPCPMVWLTGPTYPADAHPITGRYRDAIDPASTGTRPT